MHPVVVSAVVGHKSGDLAPEVYDRMWWSVWTAGASWCGPRLCQRIILRRGK